MTATPEGQILPSLFGEHDSQYRMRPGNFAVSFAMQAGAICALIFVAAHSSPPTKIPTIPQIFNKITMPFVAQKASGGGSGGTHEKMLASKGVVPPMRLQEPFTPPEVVLRNPNPVLPMPPSILAISTVKMPSLGVLAILAQSPPSRPMARAGRVGLAMVAVAAWETIRAVGLAMTRDSSIRRAATG